MTAAHSDNPLAPALPATKQASPTADGRLEDLSQMIRAYNDVTQKLQDSHESLKGQVVRLQVELASTNAKLQRSKRLAALGEMAAGIAHEIRNPLGAIHLYARMLVDDLSDVDSAQRNQVVLSQTAQKIAAGVRGLNAIVDDVLSFARELVPRPTVVSVDGLFDHVVEVCRPMIDAAAVQVVRLDRCAAGPLHVGADASLMHQALLNLVRNALDAMSRSARRARPAAGESLPAVLTFDARRQGGQMVLTIKDTGPGIADPDIDRIFNPFFTTRNTGTGLGLAIVHRIIDAHSGTISVHNDGGAVFELSLPVSSQRETRGEPIETVAEVSAGGVLTGTR